MRNLSTLATLFIATSPAMAHTGHGAAAIHLHAWEYATLAAIVALAVGLLAYAARK